MGVGKCVSENLDILITKLPHIQRSLLMKSWNFTIFQDELVNAAGYAHACHIIEDETVETVRELFCTDTHQLFQHHKLKSRPDSRFHKTCSLRRPTSYASQRYHVSVKPKDAWEQEVYITSKGRMMVHDSKDKRDTLCHPCQHCPASSHRRNRGKRWER